MIFNNVFIVTLHNNRITHELDCIGNYMIIIQL